MTATALSHREFVNGPESAGAPLILSAEMAVAGAIIQPESTEAEPWFPDFDPERDTVVVVHPDDMVDPCRKDLALSYDALYDETEVRLTTPTGTRLVCYLPGVAPDELGDAAFEFLPARSAARMFPCATGAETQDATAA